MFLNVIDSLINKYLNAVDIINGSCYSIFIVYSPQKLVFTKNTTNKRRAQIAAFFWEQ